MWDGIYLGSSTSALVMTNANLNDALNGIVSDNGAPFTLDGGTFRKNLYALQVRNYTGLLPHPGSVTGCNFYDGVLITPQPGGLNGTAGIRVIDVKGLTIGFADNSTTTENVFWSQQPNAPGGGLQYGIQIQNSSVNVYHNRFRDIVPPQGPGVYTVGTYCGISTIGSGTLPIVHVGHPTSNNGQLLTRHGNTFIDCQQGVFAERTQTIHVRGNTLNRALRDGAFLRRVHNSTVRVERNTLVGCSSGIFVGDSRNVNGEISNNTITGNNLAFRFGIQLQVLNYAPAPLAGVFPIQVRDNDIDLRGNGMWINSSTNINVEGNTIRVLRGTNALEAVNGIFATSNVLLRIANNPSISSAGAWNINTAGIRVSNSPQSMVLCNTMRDIGRCMVFEGECFPSDFLGNSMRNARDGFVLNEAEIGPQGRASQTLPIPLNAIACENKWLGNWTSPMSQTRVIASGAFTNHEGDDSKFYCRPNQLPTINAPIGASQAMSPQQVGPNSLIPVNCSSTQPGNGTASGIKSVAANRLQGNAPNLHSAQFRRDDWAFTSLLRNPNLSIGDTALQSYQAMQNGTSLAAATESNEMVFIPDSAQAAILASLIQPLSMSESNHRAVMEIRINDPNLNWWEIQQLHSIAVQCEAEGGRAVNIARGLLAVEGILIWEDPGCNGYSKAADTEYGDGQTEPQIQISCWPNPTNGKIFLDAEQPMIGIVNIFDAQGKLLLSRSVALGQSTLELDGTAWSQGLLLVNLQLPDGTLQSWRVLLQR